MPFFGNIQLASNSPRRFKILTEAGFDVKILSGLELDEIYPQDIKTDDIPVFLSKFKADSYLKVADINNMPLVTADTIVIHNGIAIGKPKDIEEAYIMIKTLSGSWHTVITGVTLITTKGEITFSETTKVKFRNIPDDFIRYYIHEYTPLDKAGSYGIQEWIGLVGVERIEGDFYNIMGFPICRFIKEYQSF